jgi:hypothetical protein
MIWLALLVGCRAPEVEAPPSEGANEEAVGWSLEPIAVVSSRLEGAQRVQAGLRSTGNDWAYLVDLSGGVVHTVTAANVQPRGSYCVGGEGEADACTGVLRNPGTIATNQSLNACVDHGQHRITLVQDKGRVELIGASAATDHWRHEHSVYEVWQPPDSAGAGLVGPCFWSGDRLWMSGGDQVVAIEADQQAYEWGESYDLSVGVRQWAALASGGAVGLGLDGQLYSLRIDDGSFLPISIGGSVVQDMALDRSRGRLWFADRDKQQLRAFDWEEGDWREVVSWESRDRLVAVEVDEKTGAVATLELDGSGRSWLGLYAGDGFQARAAVEGDALSLVPPGALGQFGVVVRLGDGELGWQVWSAKDPADGRPPLGVFAVTTLEEPFLNMDMPCETTDGSGFVALVDTLRGNLDLLEAVGIPVAVGVTWEFVSKALECGEDGVLSSLSERGFELGHMVHSRPCFNCTDADVPGVVVAECGPSSPHYLLSDDPSACWPDDPEYCDLDDTPCWSALVGQRALEVDEVLPGGAAFIFGADRHGMWGWDWVEGYRTFERADGGQGYPITFFAGRWAYPEIASFDDPRGKEPAPLLSTAIGKPWFVPNTESWDRNSAFSDLLYLPGHSVALLKTGEHQATGLGLLHLVNSGLPIGLDRTDTDAAMGLLRQAVAHRDEAANGSWYLHIRDLTSWRLDEVGDDGLSSLAHLIRWRTEVESDFGTHEVSWMLPTEIRERRLEAEAARLDE